MRVPSLGNGGDNIAFGSPRHELEFVDGTANVAGGRLYFPDPTTQNELCIPFQTLTRIYLDVGTGYGRFDPPHGSFLGVDYVEGNIWSAAECSARSEIDSSLNRYESDGALGYAVMDARIVNGNYPRYGFVPTS